MDVADLITPDHVIVNLKATDKVRLLADLARRAAPVTGLPQQNIHEALAAREALGSTGVGAGVAIPHACLAGLDSFFGLFARLERRLDYDAVDDQPIDLIFLLLIPENVATEHLHALACVSRRLRDPDVAARLRKADDVAVLYSTLIGENSR